MIELSDLLSARQTAALRRIGDQVFPGSEAVPGFSASGASDAVVHVLSDLPKSDLRALKAALSVLSAFPDPWIRRLVAPEKGERGLPGASRLNGLVDSLRSVVSMPYYASMPWPVGESAVLGNEAGRREAREPVHAPSGAQDADREREARTAKRLVVLGTLDTRGDEVAIVRDMIESRGHEAIVIDMGVVGTPEGEATWTREAVAEAGGRSLEELLAAAKAGADRGDATEVMVRGASRIVSELTAKGEVDGIMGLGGSTAASSASRVMEALPVGLPKVLLTTFVKAPSADILLIESPVDLVGVNRIVVRTLARAVGALVGMAEQDVPSVGNRPLVAITALGVTTPAAMKVIAGLDELGFDAVVFAATTEKLDRMAGEGVFDAVIDLTSFEMLGKVFYSDEQIQGATGAPWVDRARLASVERQRLPQVIAPGGLDIHILPGVREPDALPEPLQGRPHARHGPDIMLVRTGELEMRLLGHALARRVERAEGPVAVVLPKRGFSDASRAGTEMHDQEADRLFIDVFNAELGDEATVFEIDCHINDDEFASAVIRAFRSVMSEA